MAEDCQSLLCRQSIHRRGQKGHDGGCNCAMEAHPFFYAQSPQPSGLVDHPLQMPPSGCTLHPPSPGSPEVPDAKEGRKKALQSTHCFCSYGRYTKGCFGKDKNVLRGLPVRMFIACQKVAHFTGKCKATAVHLECTFPLSAKVSAVHSCFWLPDSDHFPSQLGNSSQFILG